MEISFLRTLSQLLYVSISNVYVGQVTQATPNDPTSPISVSIVINPMSSDTARALSIINDLVRSHNVFSVPRCLREHAACLCLPARCSG